MAEVIRRQSWRRACLASTMAVAALTVSTGSVFAQGSKADVLVDTLGAVPDGKTDCRAAIQQAFQQVKQQGGGIVRFSAGGVYLASDTVGSADATDRMENVTVNGNGATLVSALQRQPRPALRLIGSNLRVRDLTVDFTTDIDLRKDVNVQGGDAIYIGGTAARPEQNVRVENCDIKQAWFAGVRPIWVSKVVISNCTFRECLATSIFAGDVREDLKIQGNTIIDTKDDGIYVNCGPRATATRGVIITGNSVRGSSAKGIGVGGVHDAIISDNTVENTWAPGIVCEATGYSPDKVRNIRISGNLLRNTGRNYGEGKYHAAINPVAAGIYMASGDPTDFANIQVDGNQVFGSAGNGIVVAQTAQAQITGNTITGCDGMGMIVGLERGSGPQVSNFVVARNLVYDTKLSGVYVVGASHGVVSSNVVRAYGGAGGAIDRGIFIYRCDTVMADGNLVDNDRGAEETVKVVSSTGCSVVNTLDLVAGSAR